MRLTLQVLAQTLPQSPLTSHKRVSHPGIEKMLVYTAKHANAHVPALFFPCGCGATSPKASHEKCI